MNFETFEKLGWKLTEGRLRIEDVKSGAILRLIGGSRTRVVRSVQLDARCGSIDYSSVGFSDGGYVGPSELARYEKVDSE